MAKSCLEPSFAVCSVPLTHPVPQERSKRRNEHGTSSSILQEKGAGSVREKACLHILRGRDSGETHQAAFVAHPLPVRLSGS